VLIAQAVFFLEHRQTDATERPTHANDYTAGVRMTSDLPFTHTDLQFTACLDGLTSPLLETQIYYQHEGALVNTKDRCITVVTVVTFIMK